jgi:polyvinyl alcohol dehydrogenase (cytochrome)
LHGRTIDCSSFGAIDIATGRVIWQIPEPSNAVAAAAVSVANGVVYIVSLTGIMYALDAATGGPLWQFQGAASSIAGPAIVDGTVYWGNGYARINPPGTSSTTFYAFRRP